MDNITLAFIGSFLLSLASPYIEKKLNLEGDKAKILIIVIVCILLATLKYFLGDNFWQALSTICLTVLVWFNWIYSFIFPDKPIEEFSRQNLIDKI